MYFLFYKKAPKIDVYPWWYRTVALAVITILGPVRQHKQREDQPIRWWCLQWEAYLSRMFWISFTWKRHIIHTTFFYDLCKISFFFFFTLSNSTKIKRRTKMLMPVFRNQIVHSRNPYIHKYCGCIHLRMGATISCIVWMVLYFFFVFFHKLIFYIFFKGLSLYFAIVSFQAKSREYISWIFVTEY